MARWFSLAAFVVLLCLSWLIFELTNIWPFNGNRIVTLRALFGCFALLATGTFLFGRDRVLPAVFLFAAFASTTAISNAVITIQYVASICVLVLSAAAISRLFGSPLTSHCGQSASS